jgi:uncharacterized protein (DUF736 family)
MPKDPDELGALWEKVSGDKAYMTGTINGEAVVVFRNRSDNPKAPQWRVLRAKERPKTEARPAHNANAPLDDDIVF